MEVREKYIARLLNDPRAHGFDGIKFVHSPQILTTSWVRLRCQYQCLAARQSDYCPPFSPTHLDTQKVLDDYKFGLLVRREVQMPHQKPHQEMWAEFEESMIASQREAFVRGYQKAFALASGNCTFCHHDDSMRPCDYPFKSRPTMEAIGISLAETLSMIAWEHFLVRDPGDPFHLFGLLLLE